MILNITRLVPIAAVVLVAGSCAPTPPDTRAADEKTIRALDEQWSRTAAKNDLDGTVAFYADDAVLLPPNAPIAMNKNAIRDSWADLLAPNNSVSWRVSKVEVAKSGDLGYLYGTYQLSIADPKGAASSSDRGKLVEVWKKQADGKWKCIVDTYNSDLAAPTAPEPKKSPAKPGRSSRHRRKR
jgi:uncharacterized protein (TIGR02246 family)